jgi:hypothetical protein
MKTTIAAILAVSVFGAVGCEERNPTPSGAVSDATKGVTQLAQDAKDKMVSGFQSTLDTVKGQIDTIATKIKDAPADQQPALSNSLDEIRTKFAAATKQITDLKSNFTASNWSKLADDAKTSLQSLKDSVSSLMSKLK